jgi:hypothetical protein
VRAEANRVPGRVEHVGQDLVVGLEVAALLEGVLVSHRPHVLDRDRVETP